MPKKHKKKETDKEKYILTPLGCATLAAYESGLITNFLDERMEKFYEMFEDLMNKNGYVKIKKKK